MFFKKFIYTSTCVLLAVGLLQTAAAQARKTVLVSANSAGDNGGNTDSYVNSSVPRSMLSADGRSLVFISEASDLINDARDGNGAPDIYVRDLQSGVTKLVSVSLSGKGSGNNTSANPMISADGRFVAFESAADDLVAGDRNFNRDIFLRDLQTGVTSLVTVNQEGAVSRNETLFLSLYGLSADGRFVLFSSGARDLVTNDDNDSADLYVRDMKAGRTFLVSINREGRASGNRTGLTSGGFFDFGAVISENGRFVAFASYDNNLVDNDTTCFGRCDGTNGLEDVFVRDLAENRTELISVNLRGTSGGNELSHAPAISADGQIVAFRSFAIDLVNNDRTPQADIYVRDRSAGRTTLVSVNLSGTNGGGDGRGNGINSGNHILSANGRFVAFSSTAADLAPNKTSLITSDVFVRDLVAGVTTLASVNLKGTDSPGDAQNQFVSVAADFSADGRYLVFRSTSPDLSDKDTNETDDIFVRDLVEGKTTLVSASSDGLVSGSGRSLTADISAGGQVIAFDSDAANLVGGDRNRSVDVFAFSLAETASPSITRVQYWPTGRLAVTGENFGAVAKLFVNGREVAIKQQLDSLLVSEKIQLGSGRYEIRVVNRDGQGDAAPLIVP